jgi:hypothetical protein
MRKLFLGIAAVTLVSAVSKFSSRAGDHAGSTNRRPSGRGGSKFH